MGYWYKKKYAMADENHVIFNFRLKKIHIAKINKRKRNKYGSLLKYQQIKEYRYRRYFKFGIGTKKKYTYI